MSPISIDATGVGFFTYGAWYADAGKQMEASVIDTSKFNPTVFHLYCQSVELFLKAFIWLDERKTERQIKNKYGHDLCKLWRHSKDRGINRFAAPTPLRDKIIALVGPYYLRKRFAYFDLEMIAGGYGELKSERRALPTLRRLVIQLERALRSPVFSAS